MAIGVRRLLLLLLLLLVRWWYGLRVVASVGAVLCSVGVPLWVQWLGVGPAVRRLGARVLLLRVSVVVASMVCGVVLGTVRPLRVVWRMCMAVHGLLHVTSCHSLVRSTWGWRMGSSLLSVGLLKCAWRIASLILRRCQPILSGSLSLLIG